MTKIALTLVAAVISLFVFSSCSQDSSIAVPDDNLNNGKNALISTGSFPGDLYYTSTHEWVKLGDDSTAFIGITGHATTGLGEVIEFDGITQDEDEEIILRPDTIGVIKGTNYDKTFHAPVDAILAENNSDLDANPSLISSYPYTSGWIMKLKSVNLSQISDLMTASQYEAYVNSL